MTTLGPHLLMGDEEVAGLIRDGTVCRARKGHLWQFAKLPDNQQCVLCGRTRVRQHTWIESDNPAGAVTGDVELGGVEG